MELTDAQLVELVRSGSSAAAGTLFDRYWRDAWRAAYAVLADHSAADDVAQEAVQRAFARLDRFDDSRPFGPWLRRIVVNAAIDELRRRARVDPLDVAAVEASDPALTPRTLGVADAVAALAPNKRLVVVLRYWLEFSIEDIADVLRIPVGTVASRLSRAHDELRVLLEEEEHHVA